MAVQLTQAVQRKTKLGMFFTMCSRIKYAMSFIWQISEDGVSCFINKAYIFLIIIYYNFNLSEEIFNHF